MMLASGASCAIGFSGRLFAQTQRLAGDQPEAFRKVPRVGILWLGSASQGSGLSAPLIRRLGELGYVEGATVVIDFRAASDSRKLVDQAEDLVRSKADVIVALGGEVREVAHNVTGTIPIVAVGGSDPIAEHWVGSLARPGSNVTGMTVMVPQLGQKQLELLQMAVPRLQRVAAIMTKMTDGPKLQDAAQKLSLDLIILLVKDHSDIAKAIETATAERAHAFLALPTPLIYEHRAELARRAIDAGLPSVSVLPALAEAGFLMSYGAIYDTIVRRAAEYVDKILKGASPRDLPIEQPRDFEFVVNRATAKALGIELPKTLLLRVTRFVD
ncbi:ABC transporter substrate-binding protein [Variovorax sp. J22R24]|uniref:ABC transporter substrate-binding protein n=1 Tax=Variovorax gracilis TaxID=3053502 RepID=UPI002576D92D|nr:ABC transporter substrate-binding protein [Variovorax sp. J22R24]MDM0108111.1 ABC transporter substrate-binding protein [Variovorax sp. J22R24]